jgi:hypothetical protein
MHSFHFLADIEAGYDHVVQEAHALTSDVCMLELIPFRNNLVCDLLHTPVHS